MNNKRILITGARGFIGAAIHECLKDGYVTSVAEHTDYNLESYEETFRMIKEFNPNVLINAAGKVAGIQGNLDTPTELLAINARIALNISQASHDLNVEHVIQFASACVYPLNELRPSKVSDIGNGAVEDSSKSYAMSKLLAIELFSAYRRQFGHRWITLIPSNVYGLGDWSHETSGHVASMLLERFSKAKDNSQKSVDVWGDGQSLRNFLNVQDLAKAVRFILENEIWDEEVINVCGEPEITIEELANLIAKVTKFDGQINFDESKPNGARRKTLDDTYLRNLGWKARIDLENGLKAYYEGFQQI